MNVRWDPEQYRRFAGHRLRPALDLMARLEGLEPRTVVDLGCGTGEITRMLQARWPDARVTGVDGSEEMLAAARGRAPARAAAAPGGGPTPARGGTAAVDRPAVASAVTWQRADLATWTPAAPADLLFSNAAYHWVPAHERVFARLLDALAPGGALAVQMPMSWDLPSHRAMRDVLEEARRDGRAFGGEALRRAMARRPLLPTGDYYDLLAARAQEIDIWETVYLQALSGDDAVLEWVRGTGLRPILEGLQGDEKEAFLERYRARLQVLYPRRADGRTLYPFRRLFLFARV